MPEIILMTLAKNFFVSWITKSEIKKVLKGGCTPPSGRNNGRWSVKTVGKIKITGEKNVIFGGNHRWQNPIKYQSLSFFYVTIRVIISPKWLLHGSKISQKWKKIQKWTPLVKLTAPTQNPPAVSCFASFYLHHWHKFSLFRPLAPHKSFSLILWGICSP